MISYLEGNRLIAIKKGWEDILLKDIRTDFRNLTSANQLRILTGRTEHFSYKPDGTDERMVVRRYVRGGLLSLFVKELYLDRVRPFIEIDIARMAESAGVRTPEYLAIRITRMCKIFYKFLIVTRELESVSSLFTVLSSTDSKDKVMQAVAREIKALHNANIFHGDLNLNNILVKKDGNDFIIYLVDFDKSKICKPMTDELRLENVGRLNRSIEKLFQGDGHQIALCKSALFSTYCGSEEIAKSWEKRCNSNMWLHRLYWKLGI